MDRPPFSAPGAPTLPAPPRRSSSRRRQDAFCPSPPCPAVPGRFRSSTPGVPKKDAGSCAERLGTVPLSSFALAPRGWAPASVATAALAKSFDLPRAPMSRRGRAHVLSLGGLHRVRETRYGARQTLHQVGRWTAPPSCGPCSAAATHLLPRTRAAARAFRCIDQQMTDGSTCTSIPRQYLRRRV